MKTLIKSILILSIVSYSALYDELLYLLALIPVCISILIVLGAKELIKSSPLASRRAVVREITGNWAVRTVTALSRLSLILVGFYTIYRHLEPYIGVLAK